MIKFTQKGDFSRAERFFERLKEIVHLGVLNKYGELGVEALRDATPKETGKTADSWYYEIEHKDGHDSIIWKNSNKNDGVPIAIIIQYGHGTGTGGYVQGLDYINPAMKPIFDTIANAIWKEINSL